MKNWGLSSMVIMAGEFRITYIENLQSPSSARLRVLLAQSDQLIGQPLGLLCLGPCRCDRFILEKRGNQVSKQGLSMRRIAAQVPIFSSSAGHDGRLSKWEKSEKKAIDAQRSRWTPSGVSPRKNDCEV